MLPIGSESPTVVNAFIEIPAGSKVKYEYDEKTETMYVDRILYSSIQYPHNYGFIPETLGEDGDPLDILVIMQEPVFPGCYLKAKVIGIMHMTDQGEVDDKIIAVHANDPDYSHVEDLTDLPTHRLLEIKSFFNDYKKNENKHVDASHYNPKKEAYRVIREGHEAFLRAKER